MLKKMLLLLLVMFFASSTAHAGVTLTYSSAGTDYFTMVITDGWKINVGAAQPATADGDEAGHARIMTAMPDDATPSGLVSGFLRVSMILPRPEPMWTHCSRFF